MDLQVYAESNTSSFVKKKSAAVFGPYLLCAQGSELRSEEYSLQLVLVAASVLYGRGCWFVQGALNVLFHKNSHL
jgi:hypothetical protein